MGQCGCTEHGQAGLTFPLLLPSSPADKRLSALLQVRTLPLLPSRPEADSLGCLQEIDAKPEVFVTVVTGKGDFFSVRLAPSRRPSHRADPFSLLRQAGADVKSTRESLGGANARVRRSAFLERGGGPFADLLDAQVTSLERLSGSNLDLTRCASPRAPSRQEKALTGPLDSVLPALEDPRCRLERARNRSLCRCVLLSTLSLCAPR